MRLLKVLPLFLLSMLFCGSVGAQEAQEENVRFENCEILFELAPRPEMWVSCVTSNNVEFARQFRNRTLPTLSEQQIVSMLWQSYHKYNVQSFKLINEMVKEQLQDKNNAPLFKKYMKDLRKINKSIYKSLDAFYVAQSKSTMKNIYVDEKASKKVQKAILKYREDLKMIAQKYTSTKEIEEILNSKKAEKLKECEGDLEACKLRYPLFW